MNRLRSLDGLRGVAALSIVFWHWVHFSYLTGPDHHGGHYVAAAPFRDLFWPLYLLGWGAVDLFFTLSGFVFFWLYGEVLRDGRLGGRDFAGLRFSRLYPLHFATLLLVALLQPLFFRSQGNFFVYEGNDWPHFLAALFLVQDWWPGAELSFNGPAWSISIEALLYVLFFLACRAGLKRGFHCLLVALCGGFLLTSDAHIGRGVIGFFMGGFVFTLWDRWRNHDRLAFIARMATLGALAGWALLWFLAYHDKSWFQTADRNVPLLLPFDFLLCPATVLAVALREKARGAPHPAFGFLGDISYAVYLLHFPLQLVLALAATHFGWSASAFMQGWVMVAFFTALIAFAALVHYYFEKPLQRAIRGGVARYAAA